MQRTPPGRFDPPHDRFWPALSAALALVAAALAGLLVWMAADDGHGPPAERPRAEPSAAKADRPAAAARRDGRESVIRRLQEDLTAAAGQQNILWEPVYVDTFQRQTLGEAWHVARGEWAVRDGELLSLSEARDNFLVFRGLPAGGNIQIAYECRTISCYNEKGCDASLALDLPFAGPYEPTGGYLFRFGSFDNRWSGLSRHLNTLAANPEVRIRLGETHRVVIQRLGPRLAMSVDGEPVFLLEEDFPIRLDGRAAAALYTFRAVVAFDNLVISRPVNVSAALGGARRPRERHPHEPQPQEPPPPDGLPPPEGREVF